MCSDTYKTLASTGSSKFTDRRSRFLGFASPACSADEARAILKRYRAEYADARHVCWAYMIGPQRQEWQQSDDGEPSGTGGKPILGQINSAGITNVVVAVARYFGGIKLGVPGLIAAYREAAALAIEAAGIEELHQMRRINITFQYENADKVMRIIKGDDVKILEKSFDNMCHARVEYRLDLAQEIEGRISAIEGTCIEDA